MSFLKNLIKAAVGAGIAFYAAPFVGIMTGSAFLMSATTAIGAGLALQGGMGVLGLGPKMPKYDNSARLRLAASPDAPRFICYGKSATGGALLYRETTGTDNENLFMVIAVAGHEITSFEDFTWGGTSVSFSSNNAVGDLNNFMYKYDHLGTDGQTVDTVLDAASTKWTSNHRLRGVAYVVMKLVYDVDKFPNGIQNPVFTIKGRKLYDPRLDSTNGGSGSHRLANPSTWAWSDNPALCIADYLRGVYVANSATTAYDGERVAGMGISTDRIDWASIITAADICDETMTTLTGSEKRYTLNGFVDPTATHKTNIDTMAMAMAGAVVFQGGKWRVYAGKTRLASEARNAEHIIGGIEFKAKAGWDGRMNSVRGQWIDPATGYKPRDIPPLINTTYKTQDGGQEIWGDIDLPFTTSGAMAQRLSKIYLNRARRQRTVQAAFMPVAIRDQVMDVVTFTHATFNISAERFVVQDWALRAQADDAGNAGLVVQETLLEEPSTLYDWNYATEEQTIPTAGAVTRVDRVNNTLGDFDGDADDITESASRKWAAETGATKGNPWPSENVLGYDCEAERSGTVTTIYKYTYEGVGNSGDLSILGLSAGDQITLSADMKVASGGQGGLSVSYYTAAGTYISQSAAYTTSTTYVRNYTTATIPATCASVRIYARSVTGHLTYVKNASVTRGAVQVPFVRPPVRIARDALDDGILGSGHTIGGRTSKFNNLGRATSQSALPMVNIGGAVLARSANPLTADAPVLNATVYIAAHSIYIDSGGVAYNSGSVGALSASTKYYIYTDDPTVAGGAVTYAATTVKTNATANTGRYYIGEITTPAIGGGSSGTGGGGFLA